MYLVVESHNDKNQFIHFIDLNKLSVQNEIVSFVEHLYCFDRQVVDKVYFSQDRLLNW